MPEPTTEQLTNNLRQEMAAAHRERQKKAASAAEHDTKVRALAYQLLTKAQDDHFAHTGDEASRPKRLTQEEALKLAEAQLSGGGKTKEPKLSVVPKADAETKPNKK